MNHAGITTVDIIATVNKSARTLRGSHVMQQVIEMVRLGTTGPNIGTEDVKHCAVASRLRQRER